MAGSLVKADETEMCPIVSDSVFEISNSASYSSIFAVRAFGRALAQMVCSGQKEGFKVKNT